MTGMSYSVELVGGPQDGNTYAIQEDLMVLRFIALADFLAGGEAIYKDDGSESKPMLSVPTIEIQYLRTQIVRDGVRLYRYVPNKLP